MTEDFECLVCASAVRGDGYTNHCPACLWSRHVDVNPGDRAAGCGGLMRPVAVEFRATDAVLTHACERCGHRRRNRSTPADDAGELFRLAAAAAEQAAAGGIGPGLTGTGPTGSGPGAPPGTRGPGEVRDRGRGSGAPRRRGRRR
jgi:hypothetical protein